MSKKSKKEKKAKEYKTLEERAAWVKDIKENFLAYDPNMIIYGATVEFFQVLNNYAKTGEGVSGKIDFLECPHGGRVIHYALTNRKGFQNTIQFLMKDRMVVVGGEGTPRKGWRK